MRIGEWWRRLTAVVKRESVTEDLEEEMRLHLDLRARQLERSGLEQAAARHEATRRFGSTARLTDASRDARGAHLLDVLVQDVRYAARGFRHSPGFAIVVVITLGLGLGVNAAVFSLLDRLFAATPAGVVNPGTIRRVYLTSTWLPGTKPNTRDRFNYPELRVMRDVAGSGVAFASYVADSARYGDGDAAQYIRVHYTDAVYWSLLGVRASVGRTYDSTEARIETATHVAVVSDAFWRRELGSHDGVVGRTIAIGGWPTTIIGVAPPGFTGPDLDAADVWLPLGAMPIPTVTEIPLQWHQIHAPPRIRALARVPSLEITRALADRFTQAVRRENVGAGYERDSSLIISTGPIQTALGPLAPRQEVVISARLGWISLIVLIIACANVANLWTTRFIDRRREIAVRLALGISRRRMIGQILVETLMLAALAGVGALVLGAWAGAFLRSTLMPDVNWAGGATHWRVIAGVAAAVIASATLIAMIPVLHVERLAGIDALKSGGRGNASSGRRLRNGLVFAQTSLAVVLLMAAGLFAQSLRRVLTVDTGFDVDQLLYAQPTMLGERGGEDQDRNPEMSAGLADVARRMSAVAGVQSVALADHSPLGGYYLTTVRVPGVDSLPRVEGQTPSVRDVGPGYWRTVGLAPVRGRVTNDRDVEGQPLVVVVNETMARLVWPGRDPIGQCVIIGAATRPCRTVIGVVPNVHQYQIIEPAHLQIYLPLDQAAASGKPHTSRVIIVRASADRVAELAPVLRRELTAALPNSSIRLETMQGALVPGFRPWRLGALLFGMLGALALAVSAVGLYGAIAYGVRRRTHELGIRVALGAQREKILGMVVREALVVTVLSVGAGLLAGVAMRRFIQSLLYDTSAADPGVVIGVLAVMVGAGVLAAAAPALRASRVDPMVALRAD